jgi:nucleoside-diphosphate-sugar epimerase
LTAEALIQKSKLAWTIVRPTMIYGTGRDRNICRLIRFLRRSPILPVFGSGKALVQPIHVEDLADVLVRAVFCQAAERRAYNVAGAEPLSFNDLVATVGFHLHRRIHVIHFPARPAVALLQGAERVRLRLPIKAEQIYRLQEDKAFAWRDAARDLGFAPRSFSDGVRQEIAELAQRSDGSMQ